MGRTKKDLVTGTDGANQPDQRIRVEVVKSGWEAYLKAKQEENPTQSTPIATATKGTKKIQLA